jgi:hypothetical protein
MASGEQYVISLILRHLELTQDLLEILSRHPSKAPDDALLRELLESTKTLRQEIQANRQ